MSYGDDDELCLDLPRPVPDDPEILELLKEAAWAIDAYRKAKEQEERDEAMHKATEAIMALMAKAKDEAEALLRAHERSSQDIALRQAVTTSNQTATNTLSNAATTIAIMELVSMGDGNGFDMEAIPMSMMSPGMAGMVGGNQLLEMDGAPVMDSSFTPGTWMPMAGEDVAFSPMDDLQEGMAYDPEEQAMLAEVSADERAMVAEVSADEEDRVY